MKSYHHHISSLIIILMLFFLPQSLMAQPGNALAFDGTDDLITIPDHSALQISSAITLETWLYATKSTGVQDVICKSSSTQNSSYIFPRTEDGWATITLYLYISGNWRTVSAPYPGRNAWHHLAATYDDATDSMKVYVDGNLVNWGIFSGSGPVDINTNNLMLGAHAGYGEYFGGRIDETRIWNVARTPAQIRAGMYSTVSPASAGLVAYYNFNLGSAGGTNTGIISLTDTTGNAHTGTLTNFSLSGSASNWVQSYAMVVPVTLPATSIDTASFTANWTAPADTVTYYLLDVSLNSNFSSFAPGYNALNVGTVTSYAVTGLIKGAIYYYRIRANKSGNSGAYSPVTGVELLYGIPVISSFTPASASVGDSVVITGSYLYRASSVTFGDSAVFSFTANSSTQVTAIVRAGATGTVQVVTPGGVASRPGFTFIQPAPLVISSFTPVIAKAGFTITINGTGFGGASLVSFGGQPAASFTVVSSTMITAVLSSAAASGNVSVTTPFGTATRAGFETVPVFGAFSPGSGPVGTSMIITGSGFSSTPADNIVRVGGVLAIVTSASSTSLTVTVPAGTANIPVSVAVNQRIVSANRSFIFTFNGPTSPFGNSDRVVDVTTQSFGPQINFAVPSLGELEMADLDGDGKTDVVTTNGQVFRNTSTTDSVSFEPGIYYSGGVAHAKLVITDLNGDGKPDIIGYDPRFGYAIYLYRNTSTIGALSFVQTYTSLVTMSNVGIGEIDGDGKPDMAFQGFYTGELELYKNTSTSSQISFSLASSLSSIPGGNMVIALHDFNGDGKADLAYAVDDVYGIKNTSSGIGDFTFDVNNYTQVGLYGDPSYYPPDAVNSSLKVSDLDGDGYPDLLLINYGYGVANLFSNKSYATPISFQMTPAWFDEGPVSPTVALADFNGDGKMDVSYLGYSYPSLTPFLNMYYSYISNSYSAFARSTTYNLSRDPRNVATGDVNGDGKPDLITSNTNPGSFSILLNQMPVIISSTPHDARAGDTITITGTGFSGATQVGFNGDTRIASWFTVVSPTCIKAVVGPLSVTGTSFYGGQVVVITPAGTSRLRNGFTWAPIRVNSFTPGIFGRGMTITLAGSGYAGMTRVQFGQVDAASFTASRDTLKAVVNTSSSEFPLYLWMTSPGDLNAFPYAFLNPPGNALTFNGTNNLVSVPYTSTLNPAVFSVECWAKAESGAGTLRTVISNSNANSGYRMFVNSNNEWCFSVGHTTAGWTIVNSGVQVSNSRWTHVAATYDGAIMQLYINGVAASNASCSFTPNTTVPLQMGAGTNETTPSLFFNGSIDELRIWNTVRTPAEIQTGMRSMVATSAAGLAAYYTFDVGAPGISISSGVISTPYFICQDITANKYDGTLLNFSLSGTTSNWTESYAMVLPQAQAATNISSTKFIAHWTGSGTGSVGSYMIDISTDSNFTSYVNGYNGANTVGGAFTATGLAPNTTYYYRVRANKGSVDGTGCYTATVKVTTYPTPTFASFSPAGAVSGTTVTVKGTNFVAPATVRFGVTAATSVSVINDSTISTVVGAGTSGNVSVVMHEDTLALAGFTYLTATTWTGAVSNVWNLAGNWSNGIPDANKLAIIPTVTTQPDITGTQTVRDMTLNTSTPFVVTGTMQVTGTLINNGIISGAGNLVLTGTSAQTISGTGTIGNLTLNNTNGATITTGVENTQSITGTLTLTNGTLFTNGHLILVSDANGTAQIATIPSTADISGNVTVQRYILAVTRRYRTLSSPNQNFTWAQLSDDMFVTGPGGVNNGFDASPNNSATCYTYQENTAGGRGWKGATNINNPVPAGTGMLVFVRGDRTLASPDWYTAPFVAQNALTVDYTSQPVNKGSFAPALTYTNTGVAADDGWNLVGNPYPAAIDWTALTKSSLSGFYYVYNPVTGSYVANNGTNFIASGQAFFVQATATSPAITFNETAKTASASTSYFKTLPQQIQVQMIKDSINSDIGWLEINPNSSVSYNPAEDALKFPNALINLGFYIDSAITTQVNSVPLSSTADTFVLSASASSGNYTLQFSGISNAIPSSKDIYLNDLFTGTLSDLRTISSYAFTISGAAGSYGNRFRIIIGNASGLPVSWLSFSGEKTNTTDVKLIWQTANEKNNSHFVVERSADDQVFEQIGLVNSGGNSTTISAYKFYDKDAFHEQVNTVFYRIKQIDKNGQFDYSRTIVLNKNERTAPQKITVFPNPASDMLNIQFAVKTEGGVTIEVLDPVGKIISSTYVSNTIDMAGIHIQQLQSGMYVLRVTSKTNDVVTTKFTRE